jgi:hypothetical protein
MLFEIWVQDVVMGAMSCSVSVYEVADGQMPGSRAVLRDTERLKRRTRGKNDI